MENIFHKNAAGTIIDSFTYQYDAANRVTQETSTLGPTKNYSYDNTDQLLSDGTNSFTFDANGNRTMSGYSTGSANRISSDGTWNYEHDDEGNIIEREKISNGEIWIYAYAHNNQMTKAEHKINAAAAVDLRVEWKYDVFGNRIQKSVDADGDGSGTAMVQKFAYDENRNAWADLTSAGSLTTRRLHLDSIDALWARMGATGDEELYLTDKLGSVRDIANASGSLINHIDYGPYGNVTNETQPANGDRYGFTAREKDSETGTMDYRDRVLFVDIGRWSSEDPSGFGAGDANLYRYVGNNPANFVDPTGNQGLSPAQRLQQLIERDLYPGMSPEQVRRMHEENFWGFHEELTRQQENRRRWVRQYEQNLRSAHWTEQFAQHQHQQAIDGLKGYLMMMSVLPGGQGAIPLLVAIDLAEGDPAGAALNAAPGVLSIMLRWTRAARAGAQAATGPSNMPAWARAGLDDVARFRAELGPIPGGGLANGGVISRLDVGGRSFYGINAHGQPVTMRVNAITRTHAELDAFQQASNAGVRGGTGRLFVDAELCGACGQSGGVRSLARQLGLERLEIVTPSGVVTIVP